VTEVGVVHTRLAAATLSGRGALTSVGDGLAGARKADLNWKLVNLRQRSVCTKFVVRRPRTCSRHK